MIRKVLSIRNLLFLLIIFLLSLTLGGSPVSNPSRSLQELWNLGHLILFALLTYYVLEYSQWLKNRLLLHQAYYLLIGTISLSVIIEFTQYIFSNGTPDIVDVRRNFIGVLLSFLIVKTKNHIGFHWLKYIIFLVTMVEALPTLTSYFDEVDAQMSFPVLANFESEKELKRWIKKAVTKIDDTHVNSGDYSLKITLLKTNYSGVYLEYFPGDWTAYDYLEFEIYNPDFDSIEITCRIHDKLHNKSKKFNDRFNKRILIKPGWNNIKIDLSEVIQSPQSRKMDISEISGIGIFTTMLQEEKIVYLDYVRLEKKPSN